MTEELATFNTPITQEEFLNLLWRLEELIMQLDYLRGRITNCQERCDEEDNGLCPSCCEIFEKVRVEEERLEEDKEFNEVMKKLKKACNEDKSGRYQKTLNQFREGMITH